MNLTKQMLEDAFKASDFNEEREFKVKYKYSTMDVVYFAAQRLIEAWDELEALDMAGDMATKGEWFLKNNKTTCSLLSTECQQAGFKSIGVTKIHYGIVMAKEEAIKNFSFITKAANTRATFKRLIGKD